MDRCDREGDDWFPTKHSVMCSKHFRDENFSFKKKKTYLRTGAVPTLFLRICPNETSHNVIRLYLGEISPNSHDTVKTPPKASTSKAGHKLKNRLNAEECLRSLNSDSDDEPTEQDAEDTEQVDHYTSSKESKKGRLRLSGGASGAGSLLPVPATHALQQELLMDLHEISDKIQNFYPTALGKQFTLTFKGEDGDKSEYVFTSASETRRSGERHGGLSCDECGSDIVGFRYKCVSCEDYDLCSACEALGTHTQHLMMRIAKPLKMKQARSLLQSWCKAMKTAGVTTLEEITGAPDTVKPDTVNPDTVNPDTVNPDTVHPDTVHPDTVKPGTVKPDTVKPDTVKPSASPAGSSMTVTPVNTKPKTKAKTPKDKVKTSKKEPQTKNVEAKKRKIDTQDEDSCAKRKYVDPSADDGLPIKEEPLENTNLADYYSSFAETEPVVEIEHVKDEDPDPLDTANDILNTEEMEEDLVTAGPSESTATCIQTYTHKPAR